MKRFSLLSIIMLLVVAAPVFAEVRPATANRELVVAIGVSSERLEVGQPVDIRITITNQTGRTVNFEFGSSPMYELWITTAGGQEVWRYKGEMAHGRQGLRLAPYEMKSYTVVWNQVNSQGKAVPQGWYEIYGKFNGNDSTKVDPARARIKIDERLGSSPMVILVPVSLGTINPSTDINKPVSLEGVLRNGPQGLYIEVRQVRVSR